jgi:hypothetical protein
MRIAVCLSLLVWIGFGAGYWLGHYTGERDCNRAIFETLYSVWSKDVGAV